MRLIPNYTDSWDNKTVDIDDIWMDIGNFFGYYLTPIGSALLFSNNMFFCILLYRLKMKSRFYNILMAKEISRALAGLICIGWMNFHCAYCENQIYNSYWFLFYRIFIVRYPISLIFLNEPFFDILLNYERWHTLLLKLLENLDLLMENSYLWLNLFFQYKVLNVYNWFLNLYNTRELDYNESL